MSRPLHSALGLDTVKYSLKFIEIIESQMITDVLRISYDTLMALTGLVGHVGLMGWVALVWVVGFLCLLGMLSRASLT